MSIYAMREYGHLGLLFEEDEYYEPPPEMEDGLDPFNPMVYDSKIIIPN
jgi:hypothetical protein